ncbi:hypothetical protein H4Q26_005110 [Puccinia striiformis f. sp. tritici PST-130]|nr:hypothetical protein H4Q26_005110 [Puccinia striiformis f. sp. tritici PST-130]
MPAPPPVKPKSMLTTMIIIGILSGIIVFTFVAFFVYLRQRRKQTPSSTNTDPESQRSRPTRESGRSNSEAETSSNGTRIGFKIVGRLPRLEDSNPTVRSVHPSVHNASPAQTNFSTPLPTSSSRKSDPGEQDSTRAATNRSRTSIFESRKDRPRRKTFRGHSLDSKIDQSPSLEPPAIIELPRSSLESNEQVDDKGQGYYPFSMQGGSMGSLVDMSPSKYDRLPGSAGSVTGFDLSQPNCSHDHLQTFDRFTDLRIKPSSSIVETTEKAPPARILRKKLLNLMSTQLKPNGLRNESQEKYYWEMMEVETIQNETWWQLPFPPQLSPIKSEFELSDPEFQPQPESPAPIDHASTECDSYPQGIVSQLP